MSKFKVKPKEIKNRELFYKVLECDLNASFYRDSGPDCSNDGISIQFDRCIIAIEIEDYPAIADCGTPILYLRNNAYDHVALYPPDSCHVNGNVWYMMGGNFASTSDSRLTRKPIAVHDRREQ